MNKFNIFLGIISSVKSQANDKIHHLRRELEKTRSFLEQKLDRKEVSITKSISFKDTLYATVYACVYLHPVNKSKYILSLGGTSVTKKGINRQKHTNSETTP